MTIEINPYLQDAVRAGSAMRSSAIGWGTQLRCGRLQRVLGRISFGAPALAITVGTCWLAAAMTAGLPGPMRPILLALLFANLLYLAVTGWPGVLGAIVRLLRPARPMEAQASGTSRTAVLFPIYNEDPATVFAAVEAMAEALTEHAVARTDIFVLSDSGDAATVASEAAAFARLHRAVGDRVRYRHRAVNMRRKVGNIADFCQAWSAEYDYMVVLDADSLMGAPTIATMIGLMDANPRTGLIQTVPYAVGRQTLFARINQFSARLYTPLLVQGLAFWQGEDGNYWGHNAIIRIAPFMAHCDLPTLPGREPFGGDILCHDVVEAALMRRGGWQVWMLPSLQDTYEALPANMIDFAQRERRWCQGNLQHVGVLGMRGLRPVGRYHLGLGVLNYLSSPLLVTFVGLALLDGLLGGQFVTRLLGTPGWRLDVFVLLTAIMLYGAKLCSLVCVLADDVAAASFGGRARLLASAVVEQASAMVTAPVLIVFYTRFIVMMLLGRSVGWDAQPRDDRGVPLSEGVRRMLLPTSVGMGWLAGASAVGGATLHWSLGLIPGLLLAAPFALATSHRSLGMLARRWGLFMTPDELAPSPILRAYTRALSRAGAPAAPRPALPAPHFAYLRPASEADPG